MRRRPVARAPRATKGPPTYGVRMRNNAQGKGGDLATLLKRERERKEWTQERLAAESNVSRWTIMRWENGAQEGKPEHLNAVASALGIDPVEAFRAIGWLNKEPDEAPEEDEITNDLLELRELVIETLKTVNEALEHRPINPE